MLNELFTVNAIYGEFRALPENERIAYDRYVDHCTIPPLIQLWLLPLIPGYLKNAWLRMKGLPTIGEFQTEPLSAPEQLSERYFTQMYVCEKQPNL
jgi:hypothetical protein